MRRGPVGMVLIAILLAVAASAASVRAEPAHVQRLIAAYPEQLSHIDGNSLVWRDGTRMTIDDGAGDKSFEERLARPDLKDMFLAPYPAGRAGLPPGTSMDPGRVRHAAFFARMYGDCASGAAARKVSVSICKDCESWRIKASHLC